MFEATIAGSLPKPAWLAEPNKLWAPWALSGQALQDAKRDATELALKLQEDAGIDIVGDGEQSRQHFVHGFLENIEGIDFEHKVEMGIRADRYKAMVPQVVGPIRLKGRVHEFEAKIARAHTKRKLKFTLPGPMTIVDTISDHHYGDKVKLAMAFAELLNQEARALEKDGVDTIRFDEPAFNVYVKDLSTGAVSLVSATASGVPGNGPSSAGSTAISHNGRFVAFISASSNLDPADTVGAYELYVKDLLTGSVRLASTNAQGVKANKESVGDVSDDGNMVVYDKNHHRLWATDTAD